MDQSWQRQHWPLELLSVISISVPKFPTFCAWTVPYKRYHTAFTIRNSTKMFTPDNPWPPCASACDVVPLRASVHCICIQGLFQRTYPIVFKRCGCTTYFVYNRGPLGFWNPPVQNGAQSESRNEGIDQKPRLGDNEWKHCHSRGDIQRVLGDCEKVVRASSLALPLWLNAHSTSLILLISLGDQLGLDLFF